MHTPRTSGAARRRARPALSALSCVIGLLGAGLAACSETPSVVGTGRGVLVIAVDALRADHLSAAGYDRETTRALDALAEDGALFTQVFSAAPLLRSAHAAILTGCDPWLARRVLPAGVQRELVTETKVTARSPLLAREFLGRGWTTAAFVDHPWLAQTNGFGQGFGHFSGSDINAKTRMSDVGVQGVGTRFLSWLSGRARGEDWFAYLHLRDLVRTWEYSDPQWDTYFDPRPELAAVPPVAEARQAFFAIPRPKWPGGTLSLGEYRARYDGAVTRLDRELGNLFTRLQRDGRWENTTIVVVGSFGVGFGESGLILDSGTLADVDLRVPLIVRPAASIQALRGQVVGSLASTVDIAPTLLDLHGLGEPSGMHGVSLAHILRGDPEYRPRRYAYASCGLQEGWAVFDERWCLEHVRPGRVLDPNLSESWYGDEARHDELREVLHDRAEPGSLGHLRLPHGPAEVRARLLKAGEDWFEQVEAQRHSVQSAQGGGRP